VGTGDAHATTDDNQALVVSADPAPATAAAPLRCTLGSVLHRFFAAMWGESAVLYIAVTAPVVIANISCLGSEADSRLAEPVLVLV
jgi:hypothetical protein